MYLWLWISILLGMVSMFTGEFWVAVLAFGFFAMWMESEPS